MRTLLFFIALAAIVVIIKRLWREQRPPPARTVTGHMVQCAYCGVFVPEQEAVRQGEHWFCSAEHRAAADA